jgi:2-deoxy-D-gluconate 3-dehydrogenase
MADTVSKLFSLEGKTALVTGASGGIGRVLARAFAEAGARVLLSGTTITTLEELRRELDAEHHAAVALPADLGSVAACRQLVAQALQAADGIDILVNAAGVNRRKAILDASEEDWDAIVSLNLKSLFFLCQAVAAHMKSRGGGKIINLGSITSTDGLGGVAIYGATKSAVAQLSKTMALEWAAHNIQVNCLAPGFMLTPLTAEGLWGDAHRKRWLMERIPMERPGRPEELVGAALLLASSASSYLTGQIINIDGGYLAGGSWLRKHAS